MTLNDLGGDLAAGSQAKTGDALISSDDDNDGADELCKGTTVAPATRIEIGLEPRERTLCGLLPKLDRVGLDRDNFELT